MKDIPNNFYNLDIYGKSSKRPYNRGKSFGYHVLGFGGTDNRTFASHIGLQRAIVGFGYGSGLTGVTNKINSSGVVASDTGAVGTARQEVAAIGYGADLGIFRGGVVSGSTKGLTNLVNNVGVVAADVAKVGTALQRQHGARFGTGGKGVFALGSAGNTVSAISNIVNNVGVVQNDTAAVSGVTARYEANAVRFGFEFAIIRGGGPADSGTAKSMSNKISNTGVLAADVSGVGTAGQGGGGSTFGTDGAAVFAFGSAAGTLYNSMNKVSNVGIVASNSSGAGTARYGLGSAGYGSDKGVFAFGNSSASTGSYVNTKNLLNSSGAMGNDVTGVGTARISSAGCDFSLSAN